ncbi:MAG TPA: RNA degradosome polyphosphate kinase [Microthrixaceae bacterium]|nr:RNA degradosome polyphosphate kinase [Microthrixaceae bacterium]
MIDVESRLVNREMSWLQFNARVLALAESPAVPLLDRAKFLAIFSQNLDEFFQVRVAGLREQEDASVRTRSADGLTASEQLEQIGDEVAILTQRADDVFLDQVIPGLAEAGIRFSSWNQLEPEDQRHVRKMFDERIFPVLTPLAVDPAHPFPYISDLSLNLAVIVTDPIDGERRFARVKVPPLLPRFVSLPDGERFVPLEQVIAAHLGDLFPGMVVEDQVAFRVTRNADLDLEEEEAEDLLEAIELEIRRRRFGRAVRLEVEAGMSEEVLGLLQRELDLGDSDTFVHQGPLDLSGLWSVYELDRADLKYAEFAPVTQRRLVDLDGEPADIFAVLRRGDVMVHHPYDSFATSVEEFIRQAATDPDVLSIKQTLYRTSGDSAIVASLIRAAEAGKQVVALVELKARFDEQNNIEWARHLERAGVHVVYGVVGLKTHCKVALVARAEGSEVRRYSHFATGNYNPKTARLYEDVGLLTADPALGSDAGKLFNFLTGFGRQVAFETMIVAPDHLRPRLVEMIREERKAEGARSITMKMNSLVDPELIDELYEASNDGVEIDLIVRGICCLRPGVPGLSDRIRVRSLVGRYLEHSRIYRFANGNGTDRPAVYIGSADLMPRNLDRRVESVIEVVDRSLVERLSEILAVNLADDELAWTLDGDRWTPPSAGGTVDTHEVLQDRTRILGSERG